MPFMSGSSAGIVIRGKSVELLCMRGRSVVSRVRVPLEGRDNNQLIQAIQHAMAAGAPKTKRLAVSIPSQDVLFRFFTIPAVPKAEYDSAVQFEARKYIPFKTELLIWDYRAVPSSLPGKLEVIFAAIPRDLFRKMQEVLAAAGVQPTIVEPRSLSLARLVDAPKGRPSNEFTCLVDVEEDMAHLAIIKDRMPYLTRDILLRTTAGSATLEFPLDASSQAGAVWADAAQPEAPETLPGAESAAEAMEPRAQRLLSELSVSMDFFMREYPSTMIARVLLCGDESVIGPWCRWLSDQLHCPVELASHLLAGRVQNELPLSFASALGLVEAARDPNGPSLDFLKRSLVKSQASPRPAAPREVKAAELLEALRTPKAAICGGVVAILVALFWSFGAAQVAAERRQLEYVIQSRPALRGNLGQMDQEALQALKAQAEGQIAFLNETLDRRTSVAAKLDALARALPDGVWLTGVAYQDPLATPGKSQPSLVVSGACYLGETGQELSAIQKFEELIKRNPTFFKGFSTAQLDQINAQFSPEQRYTYRTFQLNCKSGRKL